MKVIEEQFALRLPDTSGGRSKGLHLSTILKDLALHMRVLDRKWDIPIEESDTTILQVGLAWEDYLAKYQHPGIDFHPGELYLDGIYMSPDGQSCLDDEDIATAIGVDPYSHILHEFKFTCKSSRDFKKKLKLRSPKVLMYLWQIMGYRHGFNMLFRKAGLEVCNMAKLHILFIKGDYSKETEADALACAKVFRLHFTDEELEQNWEMVLAHAKEMKKHESRLSDGISREQED